MNVIQMSDVLPLTQLKTATDKPFFVAVLFTYLMKSWHLAISVDFAHHLKLIDDAVGKCIKKYLIKTVKITVPPFSAPRTLRFR